MQVEMDEGPSLDALRWGRRQLSGSLVTERRWPRFAGAAIYGGVASIAAEPLTVHGSAIGTLTVMSSREQAFGEDSNRRAVGPGGKGLGAHCELNPLLAG